MNRKNHYDVSRAQWALFKKGKNIRMVDSSLFGYDKPYKIKTQFNSELEYKGGNLHV